MKNKSVAAVVVLYNPTADTMRKINTYMPYVDNLYVIDNSDKEHTVLKDIALSMYRYTIVYQDENIGIAKALNMVLQQAKKDHYQWLLTMDQDTSFQKGEAEIFIDSLKKLKCKTMAILSPLHNPKFINNNSTEVFARQNIVMTSGNLVNIDKALAIGGYDERLFIDEVDHAFCFALSTKGYSIWVHKKIAVVHVLGHKTVNATLYHPDRFYYMIRNYLYVKRQYCEHHHEFFKTRDHYLLHFFKNQLLYGENRYQSVKMLLLGYIDYKKGRFGKLHHVI